MTGGRGQGRAGKGGWSLLRWVESRLAWHRLRDHLLCSRQTTVLQMYRDEQGGVAEAGEL